MKVLGIFAASIVPLVLAASATAGDYHTGATLNCSDCHVMHFSQSHGYNPDGSGFFASLGATSQAYLLRDEVNALCLSCHNNNAPSGAPDVLELNTGNYVGVRQAGALNLLGGVGLDATGHTLGSTDDAPSGNLSPWNPGLDGLTCVDCHQQHGYTASVTGTRGQYRNLVDQPGNAPSAMFVTLNDVDNVPETARDVFVRGVSKYLVTDVDFMEPDPTDSAMANWCNGCHEDFHLAAGGVNGGLVSGTSFDQWKRHPQAQVDIGALQPSGHSSLAEINSKTNIVKVMSPTGVWTVGALPADVTPTCISCHKAHGNQNAFGLIYMSGTGTVDEEGDDGTEVRDLCQQCHVQG